MPSASRSPQVNRAAQVGLLLGSIAILPAPASGQPTSCQTINDDARRLACYDREFPRQTTGPRPGTWEIRSAVSTLQGRTDRQVSAVSLADIKCRWHDPRPVRLIIQCRENVTSVAFETGCFMTSSRYRSYGDVIYRLDRGTPKTAAMTAGPRNDSLGFWSGETAIPFLKELLGRKRLSARMAPYAEDPVAAEFNLTGLAAAIRELRAECGW